MGKGLQRSISRGDPFGRPLSPTRFFLNPAEISIAAAAASGGGGVRIGSFPEGNILYMGGVANLTFDLSGDTDITATWGGQYALGTEANAPGADNAGNASNIISSLAFLPAVDGVTGPRRTDQVASVMFDNTENNLDIFVNLLVNASDIVDGQSAIGFITGYVDLLYAVLGDD